jgi:endogenous inhibitor of DNA gyrase (YacG/DUF329 family)
MIDVLEMFAEAQGFARLAVMRELQRAFTVTRKNSIAALAAKREQRQAVRLDRARRRPPCPHCGAMVLRVGSSAKLPRYCSSRCMRAARWARWWAKNKDVRNAARRVREASPR